MLTKSSLLHRRVAGRLAASIARGIATAASKPRSGAGAIGPADLDRRTRCTIELEQRRHKPNPEARPPADGSAALKALRESLAKAREPALRARLEAAIAALSVCYRPAQAAGRGSTKRASRHKNTAAGDGSPAAIYGRLRGIG